MSFYGSKFVTLKYINGVHKKPYSENIISFHYVTAEFIFLSLTGFFFRVPFLNEFSGSSAALQIDSGNGISDEYRNVNSIKEGEWKLNYNRG
jgi:hypothetical protein